MSDLIKNVIFNAKVRGEVEPSTKDTTDALKAIGAEEKAAAQAADQLTASQEKAARAVDASGVSYDKVSTKAKAMVQVVREGGRAMLVYTALDGTLKRVAAEFQTNADGAIVLKNEIRDLATDAEDAKERLEELREEASKTPPPTDPAAVRVEGPQGQAVTPAQPSANVARVPIDQLTTAMAQLKGETREFVEELVQVGTTGGANMEQLAAAAREHFGILTEAVERAKATEQGQEMLARTSAALNGEQRQFVDLISTMADLDAEQRKVVESSLQLANAQRQDADALEMTENRAQILVNRVADLRSKLDDLLERAAQDDTIDPGPMSRILESDIADAQKSLGDIKLPDGNRFAESVKLALKPFGEASAKAKELSDNVRKLPGGINPAVKEVTTLAVQYKQAKAELDRLIESSEDGVITDEMIKAAEKTGQLQDRIQDLNGTIEAFNPDRKFQPLVGIMQNALGAFAAAQGAMALLGVEGEGVEKTLLKVQSAMALMQGLQTLFGGLRDNIRNLRLQFAQLVVAARAAALAEGQAAAGATVAGTAHKGLAGALAIARGGFTALFATIAANPIGLVVAAIGVLIATFYQLMTAQEGAILNADELLNTMQRTSEVDIFKATRRQSENSLESERIFLEELQAIAAERNKIGADASKELQAQADLQAELARQEAERNRRRRDAGIDQKRIVEEIATAQREQAEAQAALDENYLDRLSKFQTTGAGDELTDEELENIANLQKARQDAQDKERKLLADLNAARGKARNENLKAEIDAENSILAAKKRIRDARKEDDPLQGSILAAQKELQRLQKIAQEVPQNAFPAGVLESLNASIRKAEADLRRLQNTFVDDAAERLAEQQRAALASAELTAREAVERARAEGASENEILELETQANNARLALQVQFAEESLKLLQESGKATEAEVIAQQNKINEARRAQSVGGLEGSDRVRKAVRDEQLAQLEERQRHTLAMADLDAQAEVTRARNAGATEREIQDIEKRSQKERLLLEIDFQRERLAILVASGLATEEEVQAQMNKLNELSAQLGMPEEDDSRERLKEIVGRITEAAEIIAKAGFDAWKAWGDAQKEAMDRNIDLQRQRVADAEKVADSGNAAMFDAERRRLNDMQRERERVARRNIAIAQLETVANAGVAIARAAAEGGVFLSAVTIASTIIALGAGLIRARALAESAAPSFYHGGEAPSWQGGYTGHGSPSQPSNAVGRKPYKYERREFVMDHVVTGIGKNREHFDRILRGRVDLEKLLGSREQVVNVMMGRSGGMSAEQGERMITALENQPTASYLMDERGFRTRVIRKHQRTQRFNARR